MSQTNQKTYIQEEKVYTGKITTTLFIFLLVFSNALLFKISTLPVAGYYLVCISSALLIILLFQHNRCIRRSRKFISGVIGQIHAQFSLLEKEHTQLSSRFSLLQKECDQKEKESEVFLENIIEIITRAVSDVIDTGRNLVHKQDGIDISSLPATFEEKCFTTEILLNDVRDYQQIKSRRDENELYSENDEFYIDEHINGVINNYTGFAGKSGVRIEGSATYKIPFVGSKKLISTILGKLLDHAITATMRNGGSKIKVAVDTQDEKLVLMVSNEGQEIPKEKIPYIFEPLLTKETSFLNGIISNSLGLAFTKRALDKKRGRIYLIKGNTFLVSIPNLAR